MLAFFFCSNVGAVSIGGDLASCGIQFRFARLLRCLRWMNHATMERYLAPSPVIFHFEKAPLAMSGFANGGASRDRRP